MPRALAGTPLTFTYCAAGPHQPGKQYCKHCWPPRGRGRGESKTSPRRLAAWDRQWEAYTLWRGRARSEDDPALGGRTYGGFTFAMIAQQLGYQSVSGAWRAVQRVIAHCQQSDLIDAGQFPDITRLYQECVLKQRVGA